MFRYILFDLDGTLTDPFEGISKCIIYALDSLSVKIDDISELKCFIGPPLFEQFKDYFGFDDNTAELAVKKYRERYKIKGWKECTLFNDVDKLLKKLKSEGKILAVATSKPEIFAESILEYLCIKQYFDFIGGADISHTGRNKKEDVVDYVLKNLSVSDKSEAVLIGDRFYDIEGARTNGIRTISVLSGYGSFEEFQLHNADYIAEDLTDAVRIINEIDQASG